MIRTLEEGENHSAQEWSERLQCPETEVSLLVSKGILRRLRQEQRYYLTFVGIFLLERSSWFCRPALEKFIRKDSLLQEMERVDRLLRTYEFRSRGRDVSRDDVTQQLYEDAEAKRQTRDLDILGSLFEWTQSYGFHEETELKRVSGSYRRIDWNATVSRNLAYPTRTGVFYGDSVSIVASKKLSDIGILQARALVTLFEEYREVAILAFGYVDEMVEEGRFILANREAEIGNVEDFLWDSFTSTNKDHDKDLIRMLITYFASSRDVIRDAEAIKIYGTPAFHLVWEDMCRSALGTSDFADPLFSNPRYDLRTQTIATDNQRPDIILRVDDRTFILDAKYYPTFPAKVPALEDVRKQLFYGMSFRGSETELAFLIPGCTGPSVECVGTVEMVSDQGVDPRFQKVYCLRLDWPMLVDAYLQRREITGLNTELAATIRAESA